MILQQKARLILLQAQDLLGDRGEVIRGFAGFVPELFDIGREQRAFGIEVESALMRVEGERVERAGKRLVLSHATALWAQMRAASLYADAAQTLFFGPGQGDLKRRMPRVDYAAAL